MSEEELQERENQEQRENEKDFAKVVHLRFIRSQVERTLTPKYVVYKLWGNYYFIGISKRGRIVFFQKMAYMLTRGGSIAIDALPEDFWEPGGRVTHYVEIDDLHVEVIGEDREYVKITYLRNAEKKTIIVPRQVGEVIESILGAKDVIVYDALKNFILI